MAEPSTTSSNAPGRFSAKHANGLRWIVEDDKYDREFTVDLSEHARVNHPHGECDCREFQFHVTIKQTRTTCVHIDFLVGFLSQLRQAPKRLAGPRFKG